MSSLRRNPLWVSADTLIFQRITCLTSFSVTFCCKKGTCRASGQLTIDQVVVVLTLSPSPLLSLPTSNNFPFPEISILFIMADELASLVNPLGGLRLGETTTELSDSHSNCPSPNKRDLAWASWVLRQSTKATTILAKQVESLAESKYTRGYWDIPKVAQLSRAANALARTTETFSDAAESYIVAYITSLARPRTLNQRILSSFDDELRSIAHDVLNSTSDDSNTLREFLEMCYRQALYTSGTLHSDNYFIPLREASLEWPYDPDFESEEYYDHENRLDVDDGYAKAFRSRCERKFEEERRQEEEWIGFWAQALSKCPDGPTLFYPPASRLPQCRLADVPRYLFRAFDHGSTGRNDHNIVASVDSISARSCCSKVDLFSRTKEEATRMLRRHLTKACFKEEVDDADNLMSWSSSLLFVIQYAIWRRGQRGCDPDEVKICVVDTEKFPRGQFARDMSLLRAYRATDLDNEMRRFFDFRLEDARYDNGEYLSQGLLQHTGRSRVVSMAQLVQAGLHDLYPEFADPAAMGSWANRVRDLRSKWSTEHTTTQHDIQTALKMAEACFDRFNAPDVAVLLLSFKNRKLRASTKTDTFEPSKVPTAGRGFSKVKELGGSPNDFGPDEVQRYMTNTEAMISRDRDGCYFPPRSSAQLLEQVFECP